MTTITAIGPLATNHAGGLLHHRDRAGNLEVSWLAPADYQHYQPAHVPVRFGHAAAGGWEIGQLQYLERNGDELLAVATLNPPPSYGEPGGPRHISYNMQREFPASSDPADLLGDERWYWSGGVYIDEDPAAPAHYRRAVLHEVAVVGSTAVRHSRPIRWAKVDITRDGGREPAMPLGWRDTWQRAHEAASDRRYRTVADHLLIVNADAPSAPSGSRSAPAPALLRPPPSRAVAAAEAARFGAAGYGWRDRDGEHHVRGGGSVEGFDPFWRRFCGPDRPGDL